MDGSGRRVGRCRFGTGHAGQRDGNANGVVLGVSFPSLVARNLGAFRAKRAGERAWGDGKTGPFNRVRRRDAPATLARPPFVMVCWVSNASPPSPP